MSIRLRELRIAKGMSQQQLGIKFNVGKTTISHYENQERDIPTDFVIKFAKYFGVTTDYLLGASESKTNPSDPHTFDANTTMIFDALHKINFSGFTTNDTREFISLMQENASQISSRHNRSGNSFIDSLQVAEERSRHGNN